MPAIKAHPSTPYFFSRSGKKIGKGGFTQEEEEEVIEWIADGLGIMIHSGGGTDIYKMCGRGEDGELTPIAYAACMLEHPSEVKGSVARSAAGVALFALGGFKNEDVGAPSTLDMRFWLKFGHYQNKAREMIVAKVGGKLIYRELNYCHILPPINHLCVVDLMLHRNSPVLRPPRLLAPGTWLETVEGCLRRHGSLWVIWLLPSTSQCGSLVQEVWIQSASRLGY